MVRVHESGAAMIQASGVSTRRAAPDGGRAPTRARACAALALTLTLTVASLAAPPARAETAYDFLPSATVGVTDNANARPPNQDPKTDGFFILAATGRIHKVTARADSSLGLRLSDTFYIRGFGPTALTAELAGVSALTLSSAWQLRAGAALTYGQTSSPSRVDINSGIPTVLPSASTPYLSATASEEGVYSASPRTRLIEGLRFSGVHYLNLNNPQSAAAMGVAGLPPGVNYSFTYGGTLRFEHDFTDNLVLVEADAADSVAPGRAMSGKDLSDHALLWNVAAGWRRDFTLELSAEIKAGVLGVNDFHGASLVEPAGALTIGYRRLYWFASLIAYQAAVPNLFVAAATISDAVIARFAMPLGISERFYAIGYGGYTHARLVEVSGTVPGYNLWTFGASLTARSEKYPIWGSLDYTFSDQLGNGCTDPTVCTQIPDLERMALMLTVGGAFTTGHEQPPIFHGVMGAIRPLTDQTSGSPAGIPSSYGSGGSREVPGAPGWSGAPDAQSAPGSKSKTAPAPQTPGAPGWSGTPTTNETPGAPGWSGSSNGTPQGTGQSGQSGNVDNITR
jgi:hypothetical protein